MSQFLYSFSGVVKHGNSRGKEMGFPTANILLDQLIPEGIYLSLVVNNNQTYPALTFIGSAKTFSQHVYQSETYILNFSDDIYNQTLTVQLLKKIRDNQKFQSKEDLVIQMQKDEKQAEEYFSTHSY